MHGKPCLVALIGVLFDLYIDDSTFTPQLQQVLICPFAESLPQLFEVYACIACSKTLLFNFRRAHACATSWIGTCAAEMLFPCCILQHNWSSERIQSKTSAKPMLKNYKATNDNNCTNALSPSILCPSNLCQFHI